MGFSKEWENVYNSNRHWSVWPWSDLVSYVYRYTDIARRSNVKVLELGCGAGANIPLFLELNADYFAIDDSKSIIKFLKEKFSKCASHLKTGDFTKEIPFCENFEVVVDRSSLTTNTTQDIKAAITLIKEHMATGGVFLGFDWFSVKHDDFAIGEPVSNDIYTKYMGEVNGQFNGLGNIHFSDEAHLIELFSDFEILVMEEKVVYSMFLIQHKAASWNFVARLK